MADQDLEIPEHLSIMLRGLNEVARVAVGVAAPKLLQDNMLAAMRLAVNSALALAPMVKCPFGSPPASIQQGFDSKGNLRLECLHSNPQHCWDLNGRRGPC